MNFEEKNFIESQSNFQCKGMYHKLWEWSNNFKSFVREFCNIIMRNLSLKIIYIFLQMIFQYSNEINKKGSKNIFKNLQVVIF
jgi:hypothetical protein